MAVSTHSRLKAAGRFGIGLKPCTCFNTQPPEGGCALGKAYYDGAEVSTHSRLKAAAPVNLLNTSASMFQHTAA